MSHRTIYLAESLVKELNTLTLDAVYLAATENEFSLDEHPQPNRRLIELLAGDATCMAIVDVMTLIQLISEENFLPNDQVILFVKDRNNQDLERFSKELGALFFIIAAGAPSLLKGVFSSVFAFKKQNFSSDLPFVKEHLLEKKPWISESWIVKGSAERSVVQDELTEFFSTCIHDHKTQLATGISLYARNMGDVLDEFLMNAIWDACPERAYIDRKDSVTLPENEYIHVEAIFDGSNLYLSVEDVFGTFPVKAFLKPMMFGLGVTETTTINEGQGGAGIGLYMILQRVSLLAFEVCIGRKTRSVAVIRADQSFRDMAKRPRNILLLRN